MKKHNLHFVRNFLLVATATITVVITVIFINFHLKTKNITKDILLQESRALFHELIITRRWVSGHGGVFVRVKPGVDPNPFLTSLPNMKVNITDTDGTLYTLRNPGLIVRGLSELAEESGHFRFHVSSLKPVNKETNSPDSFERQALLSFEKGAKEAFVIENSAEGAEYRYMAPLLFEEKCNKCHAHQNYKMGDIRGGISVSIPMAHINEKLQANRRNIIHSAIIVLGLLFLSLFILSTKFMRRLDAAQHQLFLMATTDSLTKLHNRKIAIERFEEEISEHHRFKKPLSCLLLDIDHFKSINDTYGHQAGDAFLIKTAEILRKYSRKYDIVCRYGGEEFIVILPETDLKTAVIVAEKIRKNIMETSLSFEDKIIKATISTGVAQVLAHEKRSDEIIKRVDDALYKAKNEGRNRVVAEPC